MRAPSATISWNDMKDVTRNILARHEERTSTFITGYMHSIKMHQYPKRLQSCIIVTKHKLGHWDTMFEGGYDNPPKSSEDARYGKRAHTGLGLEYM